LDRQAGSARVCRQTGLTHLGYLGRLGQIDTSNLEEGITQIVEFQFPFFLSEF